MYITEVIFKLYYSTVIEGDGEVSLSSSNQHRPGMNVIRDRLQP